MNIKKFVTLLLGYPSDIFTVVSLRLLHVFTVLCSHDVLDFFPCACASMIITYLC